VFASEARGKRALFEGVHDCVGRTEELLEDDVHASYHFGEEHCLASYVEHVDGFLASREGLDGMVRRWGRASGSVRGLAWDRDGRIGIGMLEGEVVAAVAGGRQGRMGGDGRCRS